MAQDLLLEIGLEEIPAKYVQSSSLQLKERVEQFLIDNLLSFDSIEHYATPRRLVIIAKQVSEKQEDMTVVVKGPSKKIAIDENGQWTKAAIGFVTSQELTVDDIYFQTIKDIDYIHVKKHISGKDAQHILTGLKDIILKMTFPVSMTWGNHSLKYIRPIHWIVALYGTDIIPFNILDVQTGAQTKGHRFLGQDTTIHHANDYISQLKKAYVLVDPQERKDLIVSQIDTLAKSNDWLVDIDDSLLEEVTSIVEYPTAFYGTFDEKYLVVPEEVLITTMKEHQRYFYVKNKQNNLLPFFISVRNGNDNHLTNVIKGNEKVLIARLEDALFFTNEDAKMDIPTAVDKLKHVNFHVKIGSVYDKMARTRQIVTILAQLLHVDSSTAIEAGHIYKFDLVTNMVGEFPELQGIMGEKYALNKGYSSSVAQAIREHYLPLSSQGALPSSLSGALLAVSDKLDTLISFFIQQMIPSGSNDPYALRRQAIGIVDIFDAFNWQIDINELLQTIILDVYGITDVTLVEQIKTFIAARVQQKLHKSAIRYDVSEAVLQANQFNIPMMIKNAQDLQLHVEDNGFKETIEAVSRVINLYRKSSELSNFVLGPIQYQLLETNSEKVFAKVVSQLPNQLTYTILTQLTHAITDFFEDNMVLVDDLALRNNRLNLLTLCATSVLDYADTTKLVVK